MDILRCRILTTSAYFGELKDRFVLHKAFKNCGYAILSKIFAASSCQT